MKVESFGAELVLCLSDRLASVSLDHWHSKTTLIVKVVWYSSLVGCALELGIGEILGVLIDL